MLCSAKIRLVIIYGHPKAVFTFYETKEAVPIFRQRESIHKSVPCQVLANARTSLHSPAQVSEHYRPNTTGEVVSPLKQPPGRCCWRCCFALLALLLFRAPVSPALATDKPTHRVTTIATSAVRRP